MRVPIRKGGKYTFSKVDPTMTEDKLAVLKDKLEKIKKVALPRAIKETQQYGENGDFSENAEYQIAKGKLRGLNRQVEELNYQINHAMIIPAVQGSDTVQIGHTITITSAKGENTYKILGALESNPAAGVISYQSPLGAALLGHHVGEVVSVHANNITTQYTIIAIQ